MTEEIIKEQISKVVVRIMASYDGYGISTSENDFGVDLNITGYKDRTSSQNRHRRLELPYKLRLQLKSTTEKYIKRTKQGISYQLKGKNYNDLVEQRYQVTNNPLILILVILPDEKKKWLQLNKKRLLLSIETYYYLAEDDASFVDNEKSKKTILLKKENKVDIGTIDKLYKEYTNAD